MANLNNLCSIEANNLDRENLNLEIRKSTLEIDSLSKQLELAESVEPLKREVDSINKALSKNESDYAVKIKYLRTAYGAKEDRIESILQSLQQKEVVKQKIANLPKIDDLDNNIEELGITVINIDNKITNLNPVIIELDLVINSDIGLLNESLVCPKCSTNLMVSPENKLDNFDRDTVEERLDKNEIKSTEYNQKLRAMNLEKEKLRSQLNKYEATRSELTLLIKEANLIKIDPEETEAIELELNKLKAEKIKIISQYEEIKKELTDSRASVELKISKHSTIDTNQIKCGILDRKNSIDNGHNVIGRIDQEEIQRKQLWYERDKLDRNIKSCETVISNFLLIENCYTTIRRWKIENFLPEFENISNRYLSDLKCGYQITLDTKKEKKSARKDENKYKLGFTINVVDENGFIRGLDTYSKGERVRIAICLGLALKEISLQRNNMPFEFTLLDDVAGEIDETGGEELSMLLNNIRGLKMVITQNNNLAKNFIHVIKVVKENGVSIIVKEK